MKAYRCISVEEAEELILGSHTLILDMRDFRSYMAGHHPKALHLSAQLCKRIATGPASRVLCPNVRGSARNTRIDTAGTDPVFTGDVTLRVRLPATSLQEAEFLAVPRNCFRSACASGESAHDCLTMGCLVCLTLLDAGCQKLWSTVRRTTPRMLESRKFG